MFLAKYSGRFYNASNVTILFQDVLQARAPVEITPDADFLFRRALGFHERLFRDARGDHDDAVGIREHEIARMHGHAFYGRAGHRHGNLPRRHLPAADRLHRGAVPGVNRKTLALDPFDVADAAVDERACAAAALHA